MLCQIVCILLDKYNGGDGNNDKDDKNDEDYNDDNDYQNDNDDKIIKLLCI